MPDKPGLKMYLIGPKLEQVHKIRTQLGDHKSTAGRIKLPYGPVCDNCLVYGGEVGEQCKLCHKGTVRLWRMRTALFERRLAKLKRLEKEVKKLFHDGMLAEFEKSVSKTKD